MQPTVTTIKNSEQPDWSRYFRVAMREQGGKRDWTRLQCTWKPLGESADRGAWDYTSKGELLLKSAEGGVLHLEKLHWNFRVLTADRELTGSGLLMPAFKRITWVMGTPAKKVIEKDGEIIFPDDHIKGPSRARGSTRFKIRSLGGISPSFTPPPIHIGPQADLYFFEIVDEENHKNKVFALSGSSLALPALTSPLSPSGVGPFQSFRTSRPVSLEDFEGDAGLDQDPVFDPGPSSPFRGFSVGGTLRLSPNSDRLIRAGAFITSPGGKGGIIPITPGPGPGGVGLGSVHDPTFPTKLIPVTK